jgi:MFS transporter, PPP family, 3-phenylpropionic acid transporter
MTPGFRVAQFMAAVFTVTAVSAFMPLWFTDRGLSPAAIGQILGLTSLFRVIAGPSWGTMADRMGQRRPVMMAAAGAAMILSLSYVPLHGFTPILLVAVALGIAASALGPLADSLALALTREGKLEYGPVRAAGSISYMVVSAAAGQGLALLGAGLVPWLQALGYGLAAIFARLLPDAATPPAAPRVTGGWQLFRLQPFRLTVACTALIQGSHAAYYGFAAIYWRSLGIGDGVIGLLFAEAIIAEILLFLRGRRLVERLGPAGLTTCAASAAVVRWTAMAFAPSLPMLAVLQLLHAATFAMQHLAAMIVLSRSMPPERSATAQALHSALGQGVPSGVMMLLTGLLYARFGGHAFLAMAVCASLALFLVGPLRRLTRSTPLGER